jgi:hypothetical protein
MPPIPPENPFAFPLDETQKGATLKDIIAIQAMNSFLSGKILKAPLSDDLCDAIATASYQMANSMLKKREEV